MEIRDNPMVRFAGRFVLKSEIGFKPGNTPGTPGSNPSGTPSPTATPPVDKTGGAPHQAGSEPRLITGAEGQGSSAGQAGGTQGASATPTGTETTPTGPTPEVSPAERFALLVESIVDRVGADRVFRGISLGPDPATVPTPAPGSLPEPLTGVRSASAGQHGGSEPTPVGEASTAPSGSAGPAAPGAGPAETPSQQSSVNANAEKLLAEIMGRIGQRIYQPGTPLPTAAELQGTLSVFDRFQHANTGSSEPRVFELG